MSRRHEKITPRHLNGHRPYWDLKEEQFAKAVGEQVTATRVLLSKGAVRSTPDLDSVFAGITADIKAAGGLADVQ